MRQFERRLHEEIEQLEPTKASTHLGAAQAANGALREAESALDGLRQNLAHAVEAINADLAVAIRNLMPKITVNLSDGKCIVTYRSRSLTLTPDIDRGKWSVKSDDAGKTFSKQYIQYLNLNEDSAELAEAISDYFVGNYKTLQDKNVIVQAEPQPEPTPPVPAESRPIRRKGTQEPGTGYFA